jgi:pyruvate dehydrogenase E1 component beta subunit
LLRQGDAATIVAASYMTIEAIQAADHLASQGIHCDLIDLRSIKPIDWDMITASVRKTGRLLALDTGFTTGSVAGEIVARVSMTEWSSLACAPRRLAAPDAPEATSPALTRDYHVRAEHIASEVAKMLGKSLDVSPLVDQRRHPHDVPGDLFTGPF